MSKLSDLLSASNGEKRYAAIAFGYNLKVQRAAFFPFSSDGFAPPPSDTTAPNVHFAPRLKGPPTFERSLFSAGKLSGRSIPTQTEIVAVSADGAIDNFYDFAWGGRPLDFFIGGPGFTFAEYGYIMRLVLEEPTFTDETITFPLRDITIFLDTEIQKSRYAGTGGAEGSGELSGRLKPDPWGLCLAVPPVYLGLDTVGRHTFGLASGPIVGVLAVYDRGAPLAYAVNPASPQPGEFIVDVSTGTLTLGGAFLGPIQVDVIGRRYLSIASTSTVTIGPGTKTFAVAPGAAEQQFSMGMRVRCMAAADPSGAVWLDGIVTTPKPGGSLTIIATGAQYTDATTFSSWIICPYGTAAGILCGMAEILLGDPGYIDTAARVALNNIQPATAGYWLPQGGNGLQILDLIAEGSACYWLVTRINSFRVGRVNAPAGEPVATLTESVITSLVRVSMDVPPSRITLNFARKWSTLSTDQIAGVANAASFTEEWSFITGELDASVYPSAKPYVIETIFQEYDPVLSELFRQANLFGPRRDYFKLTMKTGFLSYALTNVVFIKYPRYGLSAGKLMVIIDIKEDYGEGIVELGVWG